MRSAVRMMTTSAELAQVADELEEQAGITTEANPNTAGYWSRIAAAAEALAGATTTSGDTITGRMERTAVALEDYAAVAPAGENPNHAGIVTRIVKAMETHNGASSEGSLSQRLRAAATALTASALGNLLSDDAALSVWNVTDRTGLRQNLGNGAALVTGDGQAVGYVPDLKGDRNLIALSAGQRALSTSGLTFDNSNDAYSAAGGGGVADATFVFVTKAGPNNHVFWQGIVNGGNQFGAVAQGNSTLAAAGTAGGTVKVDGVVYTTREAFRAAIVDDQPHVVEHSGADASAWADLFMGSYAGLQIAGVFLPVCLSTKPLPAALAFAEEQIAAAGL